VCVCMCCMCVSMCMIVLVITFFLCILCFVLVTQIVSQTFHLLFMPTLHVVHHVVVVISVLLHVVWFRYVYVMWWRLLTTLTL